jgi:hypothetical protein
MTDLPKIDLEAIQVLGDEERAAVNKKRALEKEKMRKALGEKYPKVKKAYTEAWKLLEQLDQSHSLADGHRIHTAIFNLLRPVMEDEQEGFDFFYEVQYLLATTMKFLGVVFNKVATAEMNKGRLASAIRVPGVKTMEELQAKLSAEDPQLLAFLKKFPGTSCFVPDAETELPDPYLGLLETFDMFYADSVLLLEKAWKNAKRSVGSVGTSSLSYRADGIGATLANTLSVKAIDCAVLHLHKRNLFKRNVTFMEEVLQFVEQFVKKEGEPESVVMNLQRAQHVYHSILMKGKFIDQTTAQLVILGYGEVNLWLGNYNIAAECLKCQHLSSIEGHMREKLDVAEMLSQALIF